MCLGAWVEVACTIQHQQHYHDSDSHAREALGWATLRTKLVVHKLLLKRKLKPATALGRPSTRSHTSRGRRHCLGTFANEAWREGVRGRGRGGRLGGEASAPTGRGCVMVLRGVRAALLPRLPVPLNTKQR